MKICPTCLHCYSDADTCCVHEDHAALEPSRPGPRLIAEKYLLDWWLTGDGTEAVYAGTHVEWDRSVAVRLIQPAFISEPPTVERFWREARTAILLQHPNVAEVYDCGSLSNGEAYMVTEWVNGQVLHEYLNAAAPLPIALIVKIAGQIAEGLTAGHEYGLLHGGLQPSRVILVSDAPGHVQLKLLGFGLAMLKEQVVGSPVPLVSSESLIRTLRYLAPEQIAGHGADERSDIYGLGVLLYEMLTGRSPFDAPVAAAVKFKQLKEDPSPLRDYRADVPEALAQLIREALHKNPAARPQTAAEIARRLRYFEDCPWPAAHVAAEAHASFSISDLPSADLATHPPAHEPVTVHASRSAPDEVPAAAADSATARRITVLMVAKAIGKMPWKAKHKTTGDDESSTGAHGWPAAAWRVLHRLSPLSHVPLMLSLVLMGGALWLAHWRASSRASAPPPVSNQLTQLMSLRAGRWSGTAVPTTARPGGGSSGAPPSASVPPGATATIPSAASNVSLSAPETPVRSASLTENSDSDDEESSPARPRRRPTTKASRPPARASHAVLQAALHDWIAATNARDLQRQRNLYMPTVSLFYRAHDISRSAVLAQKARLFGSEPPAGIQANDPKITLSQDGRRAAMRFRKQFFLDSDRRQRPIEVVQELGWLKTNEGWKIVSEREVP